MKFGIYYAYWEQEWEADYLYYIEKASRLGFDILEIAATPLLQYSERQLWELKNCAESNGIILTVGHGPTSEQNLSSSNPAIRANAKIFFTELLKRLYILNVKVIGGALYSYWPVDYTQPIDKNGDWERSVESVREIGKVAEDCGVNYCLEVLNRFENYLLNTAEEGVTFVKQVNHPNVKVMLDTFHMNIEENSIGGAIRSTGEYLGHLHTGECNRMVPGRGRVPWNEVGEALHDIGYNGGVVMEPFVKMGGTVGSNIKVWRDISCGADEDKLDNNARESLVFSRYMLEYR
jgi:D-psicose/D-tagatose/L-ribulose 3-epimerase